MTFINAYALYSTHSHTPEKMRLRLIVPFIPYRHAGRVRGHLRRIADELTLSLLRPHTLSRQG